MAHIIKFRRHLIAVLFLCGIIFSGCVGSKQVQGDNIVVKWEVEFKPGLSAEQKNKVMQELDREIIRYAYMTTFSSDSSAGSGTPNADTASSAAPAPSGKPLLTLEEFDCYSTVVGHEKSPLSNDKGLVSVSFNPCAKVSPTRPPKKVIVGPATLPNPIDGILNIRVLNPNQRQP